MTIKPSYGVGTLLFSFARREGDPFAFGTVDLRDDLTYIQDGPPCDGGPWNFRSKSRAIAKGLIPFALKIAEFYLTCTVLDAAGCVGVPFRIETTSGADSGRPDGGDPGDRGDDGIRRWRRLRFRL